jgi:hypothetical protein
VSKLIISQNYSNFMKGTKNLRVLLITMAVMGLAYKEAFADDGKVTLDEVPALGLATATQGIKIAKVGKEALAEAKNLTVIEVKQLVVDVKNSSEFAELELPKVGAFIELGFRQLQIFEDGKALIQGKTPEKVLQGNVADALKQIQFGV